MNDDQLMKAIGDKRSPDHAKRAFQTLFAKHGGLVLGYCTRILRDKSLAEDVAQEVWMKVIENADKYEAKGQLRPWLLTMSRNASFNVLRSRKSMAAIDESDAELEHDIQTNSSGDGSGTASGGNPLAELLANAESRALKQLIDELPDNQRTALSLLLIEELSYTEISEAMGASLTAVKTYIFRARKTLEQSLQERRLP